MKPLPLIRIAPGAMAALLFQAAPLHAETALLLQAPLEWQVVQRDRSNRGALPIAGRVDGPVDRVEARAELQAGAKRGRPVDWTVIARGEALQAGAFSGSMDLEAGGWYRLRLRAFHDGKVVAEAGLNRVGVGEVFITAGQSNSANYGKPRQAARDERVVYFDGKAFGPARDPIPGGCGSNGSVWPILGDHVAASQQVPVCFRSTSQTWTEVKNWMPGVQFRKFHLFDNLVACAAAFGPQGVRAVLWHQGESDALANTTEELYFDRLKTVIEALNREAGYAIPWFVAQASFHSGTNEAQEARVAEGQRLLWKMGVAHPGPVTDDLLGPVYRSDGVHFNQQGLTTHGDRWFEALARVYEWQRTAAP